MEWAIEFWNEWVDYPDWEELYDWGRTGAEDLELRFASSEEAQEWIDGYVDTEYRRAHAQWEQQIEAARPRRELFHKRKQVLEAAGLWKTDDESWCPLIGVAGPGHEPQRKADRYRVVSASSLEEF